MKTTLIFVIVHQISLNNWTFEFWFIKPRSQKPTELIVSFYRFSIRCSKSLEPRLNSDHELQNPFEGDAPNMIFRKSRARTLIAQKVNFFVILTKMPLKVGIIVLFVHFYLLLFVLRESKYIDFNQHFKMYFLLY